MDSNTHSIGSADGLAGLAAVVDQLAAQDLEGLPDGARTARARFRGPLPGTAAALAEGERSVAHATVLAAGTQELPAQRTAEAEPVRVEAARRLDPPGCGGSSGTCGWSPTPTAPTTPENAAVLALAAPDSLLCGGGGHRRAAGPEAGQTLAAAWTRWPARPPPRMRRTGGQRTADALGELARRAREGGRLPGPVGSARS